MIRDLSVESVLDADKLIVAYIQFKDKPISIRSSQDIRLIAPATMYFTLNTSYFNSQILPQLGQVNFTEMVLDCGNGQKIPMNIATAQFDGSCIYFKKGEYILQLETKYINIPTSEQLSKTFSAGSIVFETEITVSPTK